MSRKAAKDGKTLPHKFWNDDKWKREYRWTIVKVNGLLKLYDYKAIIGVLTSHKGRFIYSIHYPDLPRLVQEYEQKNKIDVTDVTDSPDYSSSKPRKPFGKKNSLARIRELE